MLCDQAGKFNKDSKASERRQMLETLLREMDDQESTTTSSTVPVSAAAADGNNSGDNSSGSGANASEERDKGVPNDDQINKMMAHSPEELEVTAAT
jgi:hypothetical protein